MGRENTKIRKKTNNTYEVSKLLMMTTATTTKNDGRTDGRAGGRDDANANYYNFIKP